jgi:hypothetical protein
MWEKIKGFFKRLRVSLVALAVAAIAALPAALDYLAGVDLRPILTPFVGETTANFIVGAMPFVLLLVKPLVHMIDVEDPE